MSTIPNVPVYGKMMIFVTSGATLVPICHCKSAKLSTSKKIISYTSQQITGTGKIASTQDWTMTTDGLVSYSCTGTTLGVEDLYNDYYVSGTSVTVAFAKATGTSPSDTVDSNTKYWTGKAIIESMDLSSSENEVVTYSISLQGDGPLTIT